MKNLPEKIRTIIAERESGIKEKGSAFISFSKPAENEEEVSKYLLSLRKKFYDATHHCFAYQFVNGDIKYSDDGEPSGTAGKRILNAQNHFELTNLITVVVRYYGGTKLGVGPLGKAYYESAFQSFEETEMEYRTLHNRIEISYQFEFSNFVHHLASKYSLIIEKNIFELQPAMICLIPNSGYETFSAEIISSSNNLIIVKKLDNSFYLKR